ncbi:stalk domain-containing protein [Paenibacillus turpanensis]|uniref:stalk domain-containing protein n=1 Tax=Paenibacillus turpanensis TaxID=2689078 RepID=UPI00140AEB89|nr:stalk domain-containing protein [Paenibacillus turpanensis]
MKKHPLVYGAVSAMLFGSMAFPAAAEEVSGTTIRLVLEHQAESALVNGREAKLEAPAMVVDGSFYVPVKWVGDQLGQKVEWHGDRGAVGLTTPLAYIEWNLGAGTAAVNGKTLPIAETAVVQDGKLLAKLSWLAPYMQAAYSYEPNPSRVTLTFVQAPNAPYSESVYSEDKQPNSRPMAKFMTDKAEYRIGEPVQYFQMSYDPDSEGLPEIQWTGKKDAFFEAGTHPVTLRVRDWKYNWSKPFTLNITVKDEVLYTPVEYGWYERAPGTLIGRASAVVGADVVETAELSSEGLPELSGSVKQDSRVRLVSGNGASFESEGLLYKGKAAGKARIYAHYANGLDREERLTAVIRNPSREKAVTVKVEKEGKLAPTLYHRANGFAAVWEYLNVPPEGRELTIEPGETAVLDAFALQPGQGVVAIRDLTASGNVEIGWIAHRGEVEPLEAYADPRAAAGFDEAGSAGAVREASGSLGLAASGEFAYADAVLLLNQQAVTEFSKWTIDTPAIERAGTVYTIKLDNKAKASIALRATKGIVDGSLRVNGKVVALPQGGLTERDGALLVHRTDGTGKEVVVEWMEAPGSTRTVEWLYYPLQK